MKPGMNRALHSLEERLDEEVLADGLNVRAHGDHLIIAREGEETDSGESFLEDRVRLTRLSATQWGLSVKRHTGRWERTPFMGDMDEMVDTMCSCMQHLVAPY